MNWSGYSWTVENDTTPSLGGKNPAASNVWVDSSGHLNQKVTELVTAKFEFYGAAAMRHMSIDITVVKNG